MKHVVVNIRSAKQLLEELSPYKGLQSANNMLVHIYTTRLDKSWITELHEVFRQFFPHARIIATPSPGVLSPSTFLSEHTVASLSVLERSEFSLHLLPIKPNQESRVKTRLAKVIAKAPPYLKGVFMLTTVGDLHTDTLLSDMVEVAGEIPVIGGVVGNLDVDTEGWIFLDGEFCPQGILLVLLAGKHLRLHCFSYLGWLPFGETMTVSEVQNNHVKLINGRPAFQVYHHYIAAERENFLAASLEFPMMVQREGYVIARTALSVAPDDSLYFASDLKEGDQVRFSYGDVNKIAANLAYGFRELQELQPEAIINISCCSRLNFLIEDSRSDISSYTTIAPTSGCFTYGEFDSKNSGDNVLNATLVSMALSEQPIAHKPATPAVVASSSEFQTSPHMRRLKRLMHFVSHVSDQLKTANEELSEMARLDPLTGLFNRRYFDQTLNTEIARAHRYPNPLTLIILDIDHFKRVNDNYGHPAGDRLLISTTHIIHKQLPNTCVFARFGGEEFVILLPETAKSEASALAEQIRATVKSQTSDQQTAFLPAITVSLGVVELTASDDSKTFVDRADKALYQAKQNGRDQVITAD